MTFAAQPPDSAARVRRDVAGGQLCVSGRVPLLCKIGIFGLQGSGAHNEAKCLFNRAAIFEPGEYVRVATPEMFCGIPDAVEFEALNRYRNARC